MAPLIDAKVESDLEKLVYKFMKPQCDAAIAENIESIGADVNSLVPDKSGELRRSLVAKGARLQWTTPYAARQYWTNPKSVQWVPKAKKKFQAKWARQIGASLGKTIGK